MDQNANSNFITKTPSVPKDTDKSDYIDLMAEGYSAEMLIVELQDGAHVAWPYHLLSKLSFNSTTQLTIQFSEDLVVVTGIKLIELFKYLTLHRVIAIRERDTKGFDLPNGKLVIKKIEVQNDRQKDES